MIITDCKIIPPPPPLSALYVITLRLTEVELKDLYAVCGSILGSDLKSGRKTLTEIYQELETAFPAVLEDYSPLNVSGNVKFAVDGEERP